MWTRNVLAFLPSFLFILAGGPLVEATHNDLKFTAPLTAITAAAFALMRFKRTVMQVIACSALLGLVLKLAHA